MTMITALDPPIRILLDNGTSIILTARAPDLMLIQVENGYVMALPHEPDYIELEFKPYGEATP